MKCPHCHKHISTPTPRQIEAYRLVHIHGCTQEEAGKMMGVDRSCVTHLLIKLKSLRPDLFEKTKKVNWEKMLSYDETKDYKIIHRF